MANFNEYFPTLLKHEGGFVNNPLDPGGATNKGITLKTYQSTLKPNASVEDLKNISLNEVELIYKKNYWNVLNLDLVKNQKLAETVFDMGVNAGTMRSAKMLQFLVNENSIKKMNIDGVIGEKTVLLLNVLDENLLYNRFNELRKSYYLFRTGSIKLTNNDTLFIAKTLKISQNPTQKVFEQGWLKRVDSFIPAPLKSGGFAGVLIVGVLLSFFF